MDAIRIALILTIIDELIVTNSVVFGPARKRNEFVILAPIRRPPSQPTYSMLSHRERMSTSQSPSPRNFAQLAVAGSLRPKQLCDNAA